MIPAFTLGGRCREGYKNKNTYSRAATSTPLCAFRRYKTNENNKIMMRSLTSGESPDAAAGWNMFVDYF